MMMMMMIESFVMMMRDDYGFFSALQPAQHQDQGQNRSSLVLSLFRVLR
jgi:hypothetical protein